MVQSVFVPPDRKCRRSGPAGWMPGIRVIAVPGVGEGDRTPMARVAQPAVVGRYGVLIADPAEIDVVDLIGQDLLRRAEHVHVILDLLASSLRLPPLRGVVDNTVVIDRCQHRRDYGRRVPSLSSGWNSSVRLVR